MEQDIKNILQKLDAQASEIAEAKKSLKRIQQYFFWTFVITVVVIVLPAIGLLFAIPMFLDSLSELQSFGL